MVTCVDSAKTKTSCGPGTADAFLPVHLRGHLPVLDGLRGLAVSMVLLFHFVGKMQTTNWAERAIAGVTKYGLLGVHLFFVLSGFLITGILYGARNEPHYFRNFYMRRVLRIFPLYYGILALVFIIAPLIPVLEGPVLDGLVHQQAWAWLYGVNIYIAKEGDWAFSYLNHFWSLSVEEHFYLLWPLVVFFLAPRPQILMAVSLLVSFCTMLARPVALLSGAKWLTTIVLTPFALDGLTLGAFLAVMARQPGGSAWLVWVLPRAATVAGTLLAVTFIWPFLISHQQQELTASIRIGLFQVLLACLLIQSLNAPKNSAVSVFLRSRPLIFLGTYSYGLYVYHHFISYYLTANQTEMVLASRLGSHGAAVALQAALGILASLAIAYASYELFEKRFLKLKRLYQTAREPARRTAPVENAPLHEAPGL